MRSLRAKLADKGTEVLGVWLSLGNAYAAEIAARSGYDYCCIDLQHGVADYKQAVELITAVTLGGGTPIVRVPSLDVGIISKVLDAGAHGIIAPMINSRKEAEALVQACRYAPEGGRSWGPSLCAMRHPDYRAWASEHTVVLPMVETTEALEHLDEITSTPGIDGVYVGPADLSLSLGLRPNPYSNTAEPFVAALDRIVASCEKHSVAPCVHAAGIAGAVEARRAQRFRALTIHSDALAVKDSLAASLAAAKKR
jgi:4-hydroxy-2-oxoheptanedioate aldolase